MRRRVTIALAVLAAGVAGAAAQASVGWRVFATATDSGEYGAYVSANADVLHPHALAMRISKSGKVTWNLVCQSTEKSAAANQVIHATVATATKCSLYGSASSATGGTLRIQLLTAR